MGASTFHANEIVASTRRLCLMNLFLHNVGDLVGKPSVARPDALTYERQDSWTTTSNKQLSLDSLADLPAPDVLQQEIIEHLEAALASFRDVAAGLPRSAPGR